MSDTLVTSFWNVNSIEENRSNAHEIMVHVYQALKTKGYNPTTQLVGYITTGDPTYITSYQNARVIIGELDMDEIVEELVKSYLEKLDKEFGYK